MRSPAVLTEVMAQAVADKNVVTARGKVDRLGAGDTAKVHALYYAGPLPSVV